MRAGAQFSDAPKKTAPLLRSSSPSRHQSIFRYRGLDGDDDRRSGAVFFDRHLHHVTNRFFVIEDFERLRIVAPAAAVLARHVTARQKIHFQLDYALPLARLAA